MTFTELDARRLGRVRRFFARHPPASDVLVCVFLVVCSIGEIARGVEGLTGGTHQGGPTGAAAGLVLLLAGTAALAVRRRRPVLVASAVAVLAVGYVAATGSAGGFSIGFALAVYVVAASRPPRVGWLVLALGFAAITVGLLLWGAAADPAQAITFTSPDGEQVRTVADPAVATDAPTVIVLGLLAMVVGTNVRGRRQHVRTLVDRHAQLVEAGEQQARIAAAAEQTRIAREMHDVVAHGLTVMVALSDGARAAVRRSPDDAEHALDLLSETGRAALTDMRRMLGVLRGSDAPLEPQPGAQDLDTLVQSFRSAGMTVRLTTAGPVLPTDAALLLTVYRVVQESLTNALRHAGATAQVDVLVRHGDHRVGIEVVDDGGGVRSEQVADAVSTSERRLGRLGERVSERLAEPDGAARPPAPVRTGRGLVGMRERAAAYGGTVAAGPYHAGWRVHVELRTDDVAGTGPLGPPWSAPGAPVPPGPVVGSVVPAASARRPVEGPRSVRRTTGPGGPSPRSGPLVGAPRPDGPPDSPHVPVDPQEERP
ncbi:MAG TPA: histidine kinase [Cellulomonas sp.]